ncbi:MAG: ABC transporter substrate-binding protein [Planctomycetota bacterium]|jgi:ribose transport system substrate-binding protein
MRTWKVLLVAALAVAGLSSCDQKSTGPKKIKIAVIPKGTTHVFWQSVKAGAMKAGDELGVDALWQGTEKEDDRAQQIALVQNMVLKGVAGIVLAPLDSKALRKPVKDAVESGVPVVIIDSGLDDAEDVYTSFVATDNREGGRIGGRQMGKLLEGKGKVIMLRYQEGSASTHNREEGFLEAIKKEFPGIEVVDHSQYSGVTRADAQKAATILLRRFKDAAGNLTVDGIFCPNASSAFGMLQAIKREGLGGKVTYIGFDADEPLVVGLKEGHIQGLVIQNPFHMGYMGVKAMVQKLKGEKVDKRIDTGVAFVTKDNLDDPGIQAMISPDMDKWLK